MVWTPDMILVGFTALLLAALLMLGLHVISGER
jgi:hypothetical protein